jgi:RHS repeat-associated protein
MNWSYYPAGNLSGVSDDGVPTGLYAEVIDDSDSQASQSPANSWTPESCSVTTTPGCEAYQYQEHPAGPGSDTFTWNLNAPESGNYTVYVKYPVVSGAAANARYTVSYNGGSQTATVSEDQTQDNGGNWISLGKYALTAGAKNQTVSLAESSGGIVVADAVEIVRDNSADTNTATHGYSYFYDADGNETGITDSSQGAAVNTYVMAYDQQDRNTSVTEENVAADGTVSKVHTTTYGYDADSNLTSQTHDGTPSSYAYNNLNELVTETDANSPGTDPQVTTFTYNPTGQVAAENKPNGNAVAATYYANDNLYQQTERTSGGTLVSSHQYSYDPDGNQSRDIERLQSADDSGSYLDHTLTYAYDPMDRVDTVTTDGTVTESYTHDANSNVTSQAITDPATNVTTTTQYGYNLGELQTATTGGTTADYNYDPFGRLDTITSGGQTIESNTYDGFDNLIATSQQNTSTGGMDTTTYDYDSLNRQTSQTNNAGTSQAQTISYGYLGLSSELVSEQDPGGESKTYDYTPDGQRLSQDITGGSGSTGYGYYTYNSGDDVEAVTDSSGDTTATYGYTAYGDPIQSMFTGQDRSDATSSPTPATTPYNSYRFNAMRWDSTTGQYDMGFRTYDPSLNQFLSRDMYDGALDDMGLTTDPFTGSEYAFGNGNPISNIELDGHMPCADNICGSFQYISSALARQAAAQKASQQQANGRPVCISADVCLNPGQYNINALRNAYNSTNIPWYDIQYFDNAPSQLNQYADELQKWNSVCQSTNLCSNGLKATIGKLYTTVTTGASNVENGWKCMILGDCNYAPVASSVQQVVLAIGEVQYPPVKPGASGGPTAGKAFPRSVKQEALNENEGLGPEGSGYTCVFCRMTTTSPQIDHAIPKSQGGDATIDNAQVACPWCNNSKNAGEFPKNPPEDFEGDWPPDWWGDI